MKSYTITVNGVAYDVTVEEGAGNAVAASAPKAAPKAASKAAPAKAAAPASAGSVTVAASAAGKIVKMEIPVVAPQDGTIASIDVAVGDAVENGSTLATMN